MRLLKLTSVGLITSAVDLAASRHGLAAVTVKRVCVCVCTCSWPQCGSKRAVACDVYRLMLLRQDVEVSGDKEDSRSLYVTIHKPSMNAHARPLPLLAARFIFDDHIRCMAAKQRLSKGRLKARQRESRLARHTCFCQLAMSVTYRVFTPMFTKHLACG